MSLNMRGKRVFAMSYEFLNRFCVCSPDSEYEYGHVFYIDPDTCKIPNMCPCCDSTRMNETYIKYVIQV